MLKRYKAIKTWFPLYWSKFLWIIFSLFACLWGKHHAHVSPRNPTWSKSSVQQEPSLGKVLWGCEWLLVARTLLLPPSVATAGCAGWQVGWEQSTGHSYLNQGFDAPSSKHTTLKHLGKPFCFQVLRKRPPPTYWWLARWFLRALFFISTMGEVAWLWYHGAKPRWCWNPNKYLKIFID